MNADYLNGLVDGRRRSAIELAIVAGACIVTFATAAAFNLFERVHGFMARHDDSEIAELIFAILVAAIGFGVFAFRRWREFRTAFGQLGQNHRQLLLAEKMASIGRLTAGVAHEMNTPMGAARSSLARLRTLAAEYESSIGDDSVGPDDHREIAREMTQAVTLGERGLEKASNFVRSLRNQTRRSESETPQRYDGHEVVREALLILNHRLRHAKVEAVFEPKTASLPLDGAPGLLGQVVSNLVANAADASQAGSKVEVSFHNGGAEAVLAVRDFGTGIAPEVLPHIFDPFFTTKGRHQGMGLGLALVKDIVNTLGGRIAVDSEEGRGTTFTVRFPAHQEDSRGTQG
jgi:signal transduction histidine kinase